MAIKGTDLIMFIPDAGHSIGGIPAQSMTVDEFLAYIAAQGMAGPTGPTGPTGATGPTGPTGP